MKVRFETLFYDSVLLILYGLILYELILEGENMLSMIAIVLAAWLGLNAAFAIRFYMTADQKSHAEHHLVRYPRLVS